MREKSRVDVDPEKFKRLVQESKSYADLIKAYGYKESGGIYAHLKSKIESYGLNDKHFVGQGWAAGKTRETNETIDRLAAEREKPWDEIFTIVKVKVKGKLLLRRLISSGKREWQCENCQLKEWMNKTIALNIHHLNENNRDNREENLKVLCPNCHALAHPFTVFTAS